MSALKTVASFWNQDRQTRNALLIAEEGGKLFDKFVSFCDDMKNVGARLRQASDAHGDAMSKLKEGRGNLVGKARMMQELGAKATKDLPKEFVDNSTE